eukprot:1144977-Pelagomonas_calceolata.AAC.5
MSIWTYGAYVKIGVEDAHQLISLGLKNCKAEMVSTLNVSGGVPGKEVLPLGGASLGSSIPEAAFAQAESCIGQAYCSVELYVASQPRGRGGTGTLCLTQVNYYSVDALNTALLALLVHSRSLHLWVTACLSLYYCRCLVQSQARGMSSERAKLAGGLGFHFKINNRGGMAGLHAGHALSRVL